MSVERRFQELYSAYLLGSLAGPEARELEGLLNDDPTLRARVLEDLEFHGLLGQLGAQAESEDFSRSCVERLKASDSAEAFAEMVTSRPEIQTPAGKPAWARGWRAAAGLIVVAGFVVLLWRSRFAGRSDPNAVPEARHVSIPNPPELPPKTGVLEERRRPDPIIPAEPGPAMKEKVDVVPAPPPGTEVPAVAPENSDVKPKGPGETRVAALTLAEVRGGVFITRNERRAPAREGDSLLPDEVLETEGPSSGAVLQLPGASRLELRADSAVRGLAGQGASRIFVERGTVVAVAGPAPLGLRTGQVQAVAAAARMRVSVTSAVTRVEVTEGRARLTGAAGEVTDVSADYYALVRSDEAPVPLPLDTNLLTNPGFEQDPRAWSGILYRGEAKSFAGVQLTETQGRSGVRALRIAAHPAFTREVFQDRAVEPYETYDLSAWIDATSLPGSTGIALAWINLEGDVSSRPTSSLKAQGCLLREEVARSDGKRTAGRLSLRAAAPPGARQVRVLLRVEPLSDGSGGALFDDVVLRRF
jgi:hypothetical protein